MQVTKYSTLLLAGALSLTLQVAASAPRCQFEFVDKKGLQPPSGCPVNPPADGYQWTHCCLVPMSKYDRQSPKPGNYTGVCAFDPMVGPEMLDICMPLGDLKKDAPQDPIESDWTLN